MCSPCTADAKPDALFLTLDPAEMEREVHVVRSGTHFYLGTGWVPVARELSLEPGEQVLQRIFRVPADAQRSGTWCSGP